MTIVSFIILAALLLMLSRVTIGDLVMFVGMTMLIAHVVRHVILWTVK